MRIRVRIKDWLRGNIGGVSGLYNSRSKKMCCLGFAAEQCGFTREQMKGCSMPSDLPFAIRYDDKKAVKSIDKMLGVLINKKSRTCNTFSRKAAEINDHLSMTDEKRMEKLKALAKRHGHEFIFIDE